jgi:hypothetical protein
VGVRVSKVGKREDQRVNKEELLSDGPPRCGEEAEKNNGQEVWLVTPAGPSEDWSFVTFSRVSFE